MKKKTPKKAPKDAIVQIDDGAGLMQEAMKRSGISRKALNAGKEKKGVKPVPQPNAKKWLDKKDRSVKVRRDFLDDSERFWRMYQGDYSPKFRRSRQRFDTISVNFVYAHVETVSPSVYSGFPFVKVRPKPKVGETLQAAETRARNMELVLNYWFKELGTDNELKDVFLDTFFGPATVELGWETEVIEKQPTAEVQDQQSGDVADTDDMGSEAVAEPEVITIKDRPFIMRREFRNLILDPDARRRRDCRWIGIEEVITWNDFIASPKYTEKAKKTLKPQFYPKERSDQIESEQTWMGREPNPSDREWVKIYTIWDRDTRQKFVVTDGYPDFLNTDGNEGEPWPYQIDYKDDPFPFAIHDAKTDRCSAYTWSEFKAGEPQIMEMNRIRAAIQVHVRRSLPKYVYTGAAGTRSQINKLMQARSDEATELANIDAIKNFEPGPIPPQLFEFNNMSRDDLTTVMGTSEYNNQSLADTATEAQILEGRSQARKSMRSRQWEQYVVEIAAKLSQLCQQNMSESLAVQIAGPNGIEWLNVSPEEIQGEFYFDIEPGIMEYKNEALRKSQLLKFLELTNGDPHANRRNLIMKVANEFDLDPSEVVTPEDQIPQGEAPDPMVKFKEIDPASITNPVIMNALVVAACSQNGVEIPQQLAAEAQGLPPPIQGGSMPQGGGSTPIPGAVSMPGSSGKDISGSGMNPNGDQSLPPVQGNIMGGEDFS